MSNMAYCRFQNTLEAFRDCAQAIGGIADGDPALEGEELAAAMSLMREAQELLRSLLENEADPEEVDAGDVFDAFNNAARDYRADMDEAMRHEREDRG